MKLIDIAYYLFKFALFLPNMAKTTIMALQPIRVIFLTFVVVSFSSGITPWASRLTSLSKKKQIMERKIVCLCRQDKLVIIAPLDKRVNQVYRYIDKYDDGIRIYVIV